MRTFLVQPEQLIQSVAAQLAQLEELTPPAWAVFVKTGMHKERPPTQSNWWYIRAAAILRKVALRGPIGTQKLRVAYGGRKNRGHKPDRFKKGSGSVIRVALQQLEKAGLVKQTTVQGRKGRIVTPKGQSLLDKTANEVLKA